MELTGGIEVRITGGTPLEVLARITAWGLRCCNEPRVYALASQIMELENKLNAYDKDGNPAPSATPAAPAPAPAAASADPSGPAAGETDPSAAPSEEAANPPAPAPAPEKPQEAPAPKPATSKAPSLEDIRAKGIEAAKKYGQPAIKAILKELGAENMTNLPEDKRAVFLEKLEGLGENNA